MSCHEVKVATGLLLCFIGAVVEATVLPLWLWPPRHYIGNEGVLKTWVIIGAAALAIGLIVIGVSHATKRKGPK